MKTLLLWFTTKRKLIRMNKELCKRLSETRKFDLEFRDRAFAAEHIIGYELPNALNACREAYDKKHGTMIRFQ